VEPTPVQKGVSGALAFVRDGYPYLADPDGSNAVPIDVEPYPGCHGYPGVIDPLWSPDGEYFAITQGCRSTGLDSAIWQVVVVDAEGTIVAEIPMAPTSFAWSPDSTRIAVIEDGGATIGLYDTDGVRRAALAVPFGSAAAPAWMPDGAGILVYGPTGGPMVVPIDGGPVGPLPGGRPFVSPDGTRVAVVGPLSTVITDIDGAPLFEVDMDLGGVAWSPTGDRFAAVTGSAVDGTDLVVVDASSGEVTTLTAEAEAPLLRYRHLRPRIETVLGFSPDGERILYGGWGTGYTPRALYSIGVDGSDARVIFGDVWAAMWRPT
jgi:Tol biopolymer transport system component